jgi:peptidoglycan/LPS O-acetylase OafA/YrhL
VGPHCTSVSHFSVLALLLVTSRHIPELDGIRGLAIAMVLLSHYFILTIVAAPGSPLAYLQAAGRMAWTGVDLFFVLSGFLIGGILLDSREATNYFRVFYTRRFFRIVPPYAFCWCVGYVFWRWFTSRSSLDPVALFGQKFPLYAYALFLQNCWMGHLATLGYLGCTWSLAIEEQFYLTLPAVIRFCRNSALPVLVAVGIVAAPLLRIALFHFQPRNPMWSFVMMPCRADALLLGVVGAMAMRQQRSKAWLTNHPYTLWSACAVFLAGAGVLTLHFRATLDFLNVSVGYTWMALLYLCVLLLALTQPGSWLSRCVRWAPLRWLGKISYGVYLFHIFPFAVLYAVVYSTEPPAITSWPSFGVAAIALSIALALCHLSWTYLERPLMGVGHRAQYRFPAS